MNQKQNNNNLKFVAGKIQSNLKKYTFDCLCENCFESAINSHSQQKEGQLRVIAKEGLVYTLDRNLFRNAKKFDRGDSTLLAKTGIKEASAFPGYCSFHDDLIFKPIEEKQLNPNDSEQATLLFLRAVSFEYSTKRNAKIIYETMECMIGDAAKIQVKANIKSLLDGVNLFLEREGPILFKGIFDIITKREYRNFHTSWVRYPQKLPISVTTIACPWLNNYYGKWSSKRLQAGISFSIIPNQNYTDVICSWMDYCHKDSFWIQEEMKSPRGLERMSNLFGVAESEDMCINIDFWDSLNEEIKKVVSSNMLHSIHKGPTIDIPMIIKLSDQTTEPLNPGDAKKQRI